MGQQQLLLLVLGVVIVGLAVVVGIQAFSENQASANADAMTNDGVRIASDFQAWVAKPAQFGGSNEQWTDIDDADGDFARLGLEASGGVYENLNGHYAFMASCPAATDPTIPDPSASANLYIVGVSDTNNDNTFGGEEDNVVCVAIGGPNPDQIGSSQEIGLSSAVSFP